MIISRTIGLDAAATFAIGTKAFTLFQQFTSKILESSAPALTEMFVRKEVDTLNIRFFNIIAITCFLATLGASMIIAGNTPLINIWTSGAIHWSLFCDVLLGGLLIMTCMTRCLTGLFGIIGNLRPVRHIFFIEGCVFVCVAIPVASSFGIIGVLLTSLVTHMLITVFLDVRAVAKTNVPMVPIFRVLFFSLTVLGVVFVLRSLWGFKSPLLFEIATQVSLLVLVAGILGFFLILPKHLRQTVRDKFCSLNILRQ
jgi:O-antigen/teichoic acid export membrane protein